MIGQRRRWNTLYTINQSKKYLIIEIWLLFCLKCSCVFALQLCHIAAFICPFIHPSTHTMINVSLTGLGENDREREPYHLHVLAVQVFGSCHCSEVVGFCCGLDQQDERGSKRLSKAQSDPGRSGGDHRPGGHTVAHLQHGLWVRQLFTLVDLDVGLQQWRIMILMMKTSHFLIQIIQPTAHWREATLDSVVLDEHAVNWQNLEVLQQVSASDFAAADLLLHQSLGGQEEGHQLGQLPLEVIVNVWVTHAGQQHLLIISHTLEYTLPFNCVDNPVCSSSLLPSTLSTQTEKINYVSRMFGLMEQKKKRR